jgi:CRP/FNR family transcriptional regulator
MLTLSEHSGSTHHPETGRNRSLTAGEVLFREGEMREHVYRVEKGAVCLFRQQTDGSRSVIEFAFPGDYVGLGYLDNHVSDAQATIDTLLTCLPRSVLDPVIERTSNGTQRLAAAIEREVAFLNETQRHGAAAAPVVRAAALLVTLSRCNAYEGRDPTIITDSLSCGVVAGYLDMTVDGLAQILVDLKHRGIVEVCDGGLRLTNLPELEQLADEAA